MSTFIVIYLYASNSTHIMAYENLDQCLGAIQFMEANGMTSIEQYADACRQRDIFLAAQQATPVTDDSEYIYNTLKRNSKFPVSAEKEACVVETVNELLADVPNATDPGLLLGKIQCGKTDTFENIIGLSFDRGIDIAIVLTKGTNALVNQTIKRMRYDYRFFGESDDYNATTIIIEDIMNNRRGFNRARVERSKLVIVAKKEATNMKYLIDVFKVQNPWLKEKKVLIVDDEADFASRNYTTVKLEAATDEDGNALPQTREVKLARVSELIDEFRTIPNYCRYLQVTATPYCLFLQPDGSIDVKGGKALSFRPRFTKLVPIHCKYIGGDQYFVQSQDDNSMFSHLFYQVSQKCVDVLGHEDRRYLKSGIGSGNITGLTYALVGYLMATAVRIIQRKAENKTYKSSGLLHANVDKDNHAWQEKLVKFMLGQVKEYFCDNKTDQRLDFIIDSIYENFTASNTKAKQANQITVSLPSLDDIKAEVKRLFADDDIKVCVVNSDNDVNSLLDLDTGQLRLDAAVNIFIGGSILDRGITINNMLCFFYGRDPKKFQQDTVLQHARFYGARDLEDMAVTRLYTTDVIYSALRRMHDLDERLRQWFIDGMDNPENIVTCVGFDKDIKPCAMSKIKPSKVVTISEQKRFLPIGMNTGSKNDIAKTVKEIDNLITSASEYNTQDQDGFFEMDVQRAMRILELIENTYRYSNDSKTPNLSHKGEMKEVASILYHCASMSNGKVWVIHRTGRNISRIRDNGSWSDAPDDGRTDITPSRIKATDRPVLMLLKQNGQKKEKQIGLKTDGTPEYFNFGWNNAEFYWPVVMTQSNIQKVLFAANQKAKDEVKVVDTSHIVEGLDPKDLLNLTFKGNLRSYFGEVGQEFSTDDEVYETRGVRDTTAAKYFEKDLAGEYAINPYVTIDEKKWAGVYSYNHGNFPFVLRDYKYMLLRAGSQGNPEIMLMELYPKDKWVVEYEAEFDDKGYLIDRSDKDVKLISATDTVSDRKGNEREIPADSICQWVVCYKIKKILKYQAAISASNDEENED